MSTSNPYVEIFQTRLTSDLYAIYKQCSNVLLEDGGLTLGLITDSEFYAIANEVVTDFLSKTQIIKKVFCVPLLVGVDTYTKPDQLGEIDEALAGQTHINRTSGFYLDNSDPSWPTQFNQPQSFKEDEVPVNQIQLSPMPNVEGELTYTYDQGYGVPASTSGAVDFDIQANPSTPGYGVFAEAIGNPYLEAAGTGYGVYADMVCSTGNLTMIGNVIPTDPTYIQLIPASFQCYLKYGILSRIFSTNSELKDEQKATYCQARYAEGVNLAGAIMANIYTEQANA
jgi:hypothetical protein